MTAEMSNSTENGHDTRLPVATSAILMVAGLLVHSFIVAINVTDRLKGKSMKPTDLIITSIGISRTFYHISCLLHMFSCRFSAGLDTFCAFPLFIWEASGFSSVCLSTLLSIFFFFRISTFHNAFFLHVKANILRRVVHLIVTSVLLGWGYSSVYIVLNIFLVNLSDQSILDSDFNKRTHTISICYLLLNMFPLLMFFISSLILMIFLGLHIMKMKSSTGVTSGTDTYCRAMKFTAVSFMTSASCIMIDVSTQYITTLFGPRWMYFIWNIFPVLYSICLIYVTTKLRDRLCMIVCCGTGCFFRRKATHPKAKEMVEVAPS